MAKLILNSIKKIDDAIENRIYKTLAENKLHHVLFWLVYIIFWVFLYRSLGIYTALLLSFIIIFLHASVSYFNIYYLFPQILKKKEYLSYALSLILSISLAAILLSFALSFFETTTTNNLWSLSMFVGNLSSISYTVAITMSLKLVKQWYEKERLAKNMERLKMEAELKFLKTQINPHFLFNSLNSLYSLALVKSDKAPQLILGLSNLLRYMLYESGDEKVELSQEINYIKDYLEIEKIRYGNRLEVDFKIEGTTENIKIAPLLFIPFIENSFKHGISKRLGANKIEITIKVEDNEIFFKTSNPKPKEQLNQINNKTDLGGIGIENVKKRLKIIYPKKHKISINNKESTFEVELLIKTDQILLK